MLLDIVSIFQISLNNATFITAWLILVAVFYFLFYFKKRYLSIVEKFSERKNSTLLGGSLVLAFVIISIAHFILRNPG